MFRCVVLACVSVCCCFSYVVLFRYDLVYDVALGCVLVCLLWCVVMRCYYCVVIVSGAVMICCVLW